MNITVTKLPKSFVEFTIELSSEEAQPFILRAAKKLAAEIKIDGFRPGHAPYDVVKQRLGEMAIYERALEELVNTTFREALAKEKIESIGSPEIEVTKMAPGNAIEYKARVAVLPEIILPEIDAVKKIVRKKIEVSVEEVDKAVKELQRMQRKEVIADHELRATDKAVIDLEMFLDNVAVEGGQALQHAIYLSDDYFIPGFKEKLVGMKKNEVRSFMLPFPKEHFQKHLSGRDVDFRVTLKDIYEVTHPSLDDTFAGTLGQKSIDALRALLKENILKEKEVRESQRLEYEALNQLAEATRFSEIPEILLANEIEKMLEELKQNITRQGMNFEEYLGAIKKSEADLKLDFAAGAIQRIKMALASRAFSERENIDVSEEEINSEIDKAREYYKDDAEAKKNLSTSQTRSYLYNSLRNKKAIQRLLELLVEEKN